MQIAFFGSSLTSAYWNGAATYYRGIIRALHNLGHEVTFYEPDAYERQSYRDIPDPEWARVVVYPANREAALRAVAEARTADLIVKASGVGVFDELLEHALLDIKTASNLVVFWDVDAPATLDRVHNDPSDPFLELIPNYDAIFTYGGGEPVIRAYRSLGARECLPVYNALDPSTHYPVMAESRFDADLAFLGNRLPDRELRFHEFFVKPAERLFRKRFLLAGAGWGDKRLSSNVEWIDHLYTREHNAFNASAKVVLNISRDSMARYGFSPATRVFEAAGAAACMITDSWRGIEMFFEPAKEILTAANGEQVIEILNSLTRAEAQAMGRAALKRVLAEHTYAHRVQLIGSLLDLRVTETTATV
jgi:spore maturation protein CgeB